VRFRVGNEYFPSQFGIKAHNVHGDFQKSAFPRHGTALTARFEYEQTIPDIRTFDPNDTRFIENEMVRKAVEGILAVSGPFGLQFASDVDRQASRFVVMKQQKTLCFEPVLDLCTYYGFPDPSDMIWRRLPGSRNGEQVSAEALLKLTGGQAIGFVPQVEMEFKRKNSAKKRMEISDISVAEEQIRSHFEETVGHPLAPKFVSKSEDGYALKAREMPWSVPASQEVPSGPKILSFNPPRRLRSLAL
jgi:hypothetical protein